jgi:hypothetical protein
MRRTDVFVQEKLHLVPLSVSAAWIGHVALHCAVLLAKLDVAARPVERSGGLSRDLPGCRTFGMGLAPPRL